RRRCTRRPRASGSTTSHVLLLHTEGTLAATSTRDVVASERERQPWIALSRSPVFIHCSAVLVNPSHEDALKAAAGRAEVSFSREDEESIRSLAGELGEPLELVAEMYGHELGRLRRGARVTSFLPLVVSRLVRRRRVQGRLSIS